MAIDNELLADRDRVLDALECPTHGRCIPGALEQIAKMRADLATALRNVDALRGALKSSVVAREAIATLFRIENAAHDCTIKERDALAAELDGRNASMAHDREFLGKLVRSTWVAWAREQQDPKPHWLEPWAALDEPMREVDRRIGERVASVAVALLDREIERKDETIAELRAELAAVKGEK